jgi:hypothetical protein
MRAEIDDLRRLVEFRADVGSGTRGGGDATKAASPKRARRSPRAAANARTSPRRTATPPVPVAINPVPVAVRRTSVAAKPMHEYTAGRRHQATVRLAIAENEAQVLVKRTRFGPRHSGCDCRDAARVVAEARQEEEKGEGGTLVASYKTSPEMPARPE